MVRFSNRSDKLNMKERLPYLVLAFIILIQVIVCFHYCILKKGFFVDELWGAGLANSYFRPRLYTPDVFNTNEYLGGDYFTDYLTVSSDQGFSILSVWDNQSKDSHPPLYFLFYHILSWINAGVFSKWTGFAINVVFLVLTDICIFLIARRITGYSLTGLAAVALWGGSAETVSYVLCARMYMMAAFFVALFLYRSLILYDSIDSVEETDRKKRLYLVLATAGGCLTHLYCYIAFFAMTVFICLSCALKKGIKNSCKFGVTVLGGVALSWIIYPLLFVSLSNGDGRGREAVHNLMDLGNWWRKIVEMSGQIEIKLLYRPVLLFVAFSSVLIIVSVILCLVGKNADSVIRNRVSLLVIIELSFYSYLLAIAKLQPYNTNRYYYPITPLLWIMVLGNIVLLICVLASRYRTKISNSILFSVILAVTVFAGIGVVKSHIDKKVMFLYPRQEAVNKMINQMGEPSCIFVAHDRQYILTAHCLELSHCSEVLCVDVDSASDLMNYDIHDEKETALLYIDDQIEQTEYIEQILAQTSYNSCTLIGRGSGVWWEDAEEAYIYCLAK